MMTPGYRIGSALRDFSTRNGRRTDVGAGLSITPLRAALEVLL
jgi:hypothetical protein